MCLNCVHPKTKKILWKNQNNFWRNWSTTSVIFDYPSNHHMPKKSQGKTFDSIDKGKMKQLLLVYGLSKETVTAIMMLYKKSKAMFHSPDSDTNFFNIVARGLQGDTLAPYMLIICLGSILQMLIELIKENGFALKNAWSRHRLYRWFHASGKYTCPGRNPAT